MFAVEEQLTRLTQHICVSSELMLSWSHFLKFRERLANLLDLLHRVLISKEIQLWSEVLEGGKAAIFLTNSEFEARIIPIVLNNCVGSPISWAKPFIFANSSNSFELSNSSPVLQEFTYISNKIKRGVTTGRTSVDRDGDCEIRDL